MKKIFSLLLVAALAVSLAVPAFASAELSGVYVMELFPDGPIGGSLSYTVGSDSGDFIFHSNGVGVHTIFVGKSGSTGRLKINYNNTEVYHATADGSNGWIDDGYRTMDFSDSTWVIDNFFAWVSSNAVAVVPECDGSTCPATDVNVDAICDDCGGMFYNLQRTPVVPDVTGTNKQWALFSGTWEGKQGYYYVVSTSSANYTLRGDLLDEYYKITYDGQAESSLYVSYDGINWAREAMAFTDSRFVPLNETTTLVDSSHNWYDANGELFFPLPLWMEVEKVTQGEMANLPMETGGTMKTLVVCGVGLMACLVVLSLFGKRSLIFRG